MKVKLAVNSLPIVRYPFVKNYYYYSPPRPRGRHLLDPLIPIVLVYLSRVPQNHRINLACKANKGVFVSNA